MNVLKEKWRDSSDYSEKGESIRRVNTYRYEYNSSERMKENMSSTQKVGGWHRQKRKLIIIKSDT